MVPKAKRLPPSSGEPGELRALAASHAEPEVADHLIVYRGPEVLLWAADAGDNEVQLSRSLAPGTVERFKAALGTSLREGRQRTVGRVTSRTDEGRSIAEAKAAQIAALDWEDLDAYGLRVEEMKSPSGQLFRVKSLTYWDMEEWESDLYVSVRVYAASGWRKRWPYKAGRTRDGETLPPRP